MVGNHARVPSNDSPLSSHIIASVSAKAASGSLNSRYDWGTAFGIYKEFPKLKETQELRDHALEVQTLLQKVPDLRNMTGQKIVDTLKEQVILTLRPRQAEALEALTDQIKSAWMDPQVRTGDPQGLVQKLVNLIYNMREGTATTPEKVLGLANTLAAALVADETPPITAKSFKRRHDRDCVEIKASGSGKKQKAERTPSPGQRSSMEALYSTKPLATMEKQSVSPMQVPSDVYQKNPIFKIFGYYKTLVRQEDLKPLKEIEAYESTVENLLAQLPSLNGVNEGELRQKMLKIAEANNAQKFLVLNKNTFGLIDLENSPGHCAADPGKIIPTVLRMLAKVQAHGENGSYLKGDEFKKDFKHLQQALLQTLTPTRVSSPSLYKRADPVDSPTKLTTTASASTTTTTVESTQPEQEKRSKRKDKKAKKSGRAKSMVSLYSAPASTATGTALAAWSTTSTVATTATSGVSSVSFEKDKKFLFSRECYKSLCKYINSANKQLKTTAVYGLFKVLSALEQTGLHLSSSDEEKNNRLRDAVNEAHLTDHEKKRLIDAGRKCRENKQLLGAGSKAEKLASTISLIGQAVEANWKAQN